MLEPLEESDRLIEFEAVFNFRDLGGYPTAGGGRTRWRRLFRADGLNRLRAEEADRFAGLGISTVVDLRTPDEVSAGRCPDADGVAYHHLPMFDVMPNWDVEDPEADGYLAARYAEMLATGAEAVAGTLRLLADDAAYPLVFHCAAGKDRTGIMAAIVLDLVGVPDDVIVADYARSGEAMQRLMSWARSNQGTFPAPRAPVPSAAVESHPDTMARFLGHLRDAYGGGEGLARHVGLPTDVPARIRELMVSHPGNNPAT